MNIKPNVVNLHFIDFCNYKCAYCFVKKENHMLTLEQIMTIVDNVKEYFDKHKLQGRINLVGGEIFLFNDLQKVIDYIYSKNIKVSMVTNGSLLTEEFIMENKDKLETIGISVDSLDENTNIKIGRCCRNKTMKKERLIELCKCIKNNNIKLKINTCVSKYNINEDLSDFIETVNPDRYKILQMIIVKGVNEKLLPYKTTNQEFKAYCSKIKHLNPICETDSEISNSYLMIDSKGDFCVDNNTNNKPIGNAIIENFDELVNKSNFNIENFNKRYSKKG